MVEQKPGSGIQNHDDLRGQHTIHGKHRGYLDSFFHHDLPEQERRGNAGGLFDQLEQMGIQDGHIVSMYDLEFEYQR